VFRLDDPAWDLIAPPNGFNCRCRARNLSQRELDARGLRAETDTQIHEREPPGKRPVDPRTGQTPDPWTQRGVSIPDPLNPGERRYLWPDAGWDYNPGRSGLEQLEALVKRKEEALGLASSAGANAATSVVSDFVDRVLANRRQKQAALIVAPIPDTFAVAAGSLEGVALDGKSLALDHDYLLHIFDRHGGAGEVMRGQIPVTAADLAAIAANLATGRDIRLGDPPRAKNGAARIVAVFEIGGYRLDVVFEVRRRVLVPVTVWKRRA